MLCEGRYRKEKETKVKTKNDRNGTEEKKEVFVRCNEITKLTKGVYILF